MYRPGTVVQGEFGFGLTRRDRFQRCGRIRAAAGVFLDRCLDRRAVGTVNRKGQPPDCKRGFLAALPGTF